MGRIPPKAPCLGLGVGGVRKMPEGPILSFLLLHLLPFLLVLPLPFPLPVPFPLPLLLLLFFSSSSASKQILYTFPCVSPKRKYYTCHRYSFLGNGSHFDDYSRNRISAHTFPRRSQGTHSVPRAVKL